MNKISILSAHSNAFSYSHSPAPTALGLAVHLGWLSGDRGSESTAIRSLREGRLLSDAERHGEYALANAFRQGSIMPPAWAHARGAATRVIGLSWTDESQQLLALPGNGIAATRHLRGRRFGLPVHRGELVDHFRASALRTLLTVLALDGLTHKDVEIVPIEANPKKLFEAEADALLRNEVDVIYVRGLAGARVAKALALKSVIDLRLHPESRVRNNGCTLRVFTASAQILERFPDLGNSFLRLAIDAADWASAHPREAFAYAAQEGDVDETLVHAAYGDQFPDHLQLNLCDEWIAALKDFTTFLTDWGFIERAIDVDQWIDYTAFDAVMTARNGRLSA
ncbi:ABC transporter substrate-binding protein [Caballeronia sp. 15711]|uniref:ABC transporter substrate-binding protein n=1 Tax=unclassified Caballeronia TaxID=2646786 RepID=UPI0039E417D7